MVLIPLLWLAAVFKKRRHITRDGIETAFQNLDLGRHGNCFNECHDTGLISISTAHISPCCMRFGGLIDYSGRGFSAKTLSSLQLGNEQVGMEGLETFELRSSSGSKPELHLE